MVSEANDEVDLAARIKAWFERAADDDQLSAVAIGLGLRLEIEFDQQQERIGLYIGSREKDEQHRIRLSAPPQVWEQVMEPSPKPGYQAFTALRRMVPAFSVSGSELVIAQSLAAIERLFELARPAPDDALAGDVADNAPALSEIRGQYCRLRIKSDQAVVYYEEAGQGPPLLLLHTAGADSRQYLALLANSQMQAQWHMYAFDMPFHGRSLPTDAWHGERYSLRQADYLAWCLAFIEAVVAAPVAVTGCSMGAAIAVALAASGSPWVSAVLALEAPDRSPGRLNPYLSHAAVNQALHNAAYVRGLMSPTSPERTRDLACWYYAQGGPGVYSGDLEYYSQEYDGTQLAKSIDTERCPVIFLTGEYDYSAPPEATRRLAALIPGARFEVLEGLGHFPMTEDPARFLRAAQPALRRLRAAVEPD